MKILTAYVILAQKEIRLHSSPPDDVPLQPVYYLEPSCTLHYHALYNSQNTNTHLKSKSLYMHYNNRT